MPGLKTLFQRNQKGARSVSANQNVSGVFDARRHLNSYQYLTTIERYQQQTIKLLGADFVIADGMSFYFSFEEIFAKEIYKFRCETDSPRIIDCGANYGTSVAYFKHACPEAEITAVEADPNVCDLLRRNVESLGLTNVELIHRAVSDQKGSISFCQEGADSGRIEKEATGNQVVQIETVQLDDLIGESSVDFLKMDIEGAETDVIAGSQRLSQISQLFIEYHGFRGQPQRLTTLLDRLTRAGFRYYIHSQFCSPRPLTESQEYLGMDLQLNIFCLREEEN